MVLGGAYQPPQRQPMDLACHHLETIWQEKTTRETSEAVERWPGQILERHDMAEDSTRQGTLEAACWGICPTTGHNGCLMMMNMNKVGSVTALRTFQQLTSQNKRNTSIFCTHSAVYGETGRLFCSLSLSMNCWTFHSMRVNSSTSRMSSIRINIICLSIFFYLDQQYCSNSSFTTFMGYLVVQKKIHSCCRPIFLTRLSF